MPTKAIAAGWLSNCGSAFVVAGVMAVALGIWGFLCSSALLGLPTVRKAQQCPQPLSGGYMLADGLSEFVGRWD